MNIFNKKTILFFSISTLIVTGSIAKNGFERELSPQVSTKTAWGKSNQLNTKKKNDCVNCYATGLTKSFAKVKRSNSIKKAKKTKYYGTYAYTESAADTKIKTKKAKKVNHNRYVLPAISSISSSSGKYRTYSKNIDTAIQVGAFRRYEGAKIYKRRYNALSNKYNVSIKRASINHKPLYRVSIEGFKNRAKAKKFMNTYGIQNGFLVRR